MISSNGCAGNPGVHQRALGFGRELRPYGRCHSRRRVRRLSQHRDYQVQQLANRADLVLNAAGDEAGVFSGKVLSLVAGAVN